MPYTIAKMPGGWWVMKKGTHEKMHERAHPTKADAQRHMRALYAAEPEARKR